jgi:hypothetical protein
MIESVITHMQVPQTREPSELRPTQGLEPAESSTDIGQSTECVVFTAFSAAITDHL